MLRDEALGDFSDRRAAKLLDADADDLYHVRVNWRLRGFRSFFSPQGKGDFADS